MPRSRPRPSVRPRPSCSWTLLTPFTPGEQVIVDHVFTAGLNHTRPFIVQREIQIKPGDPLSQIDMLNTQKRLYDLGIFSQVDTAVQNPDSSEREKNVLVNVQEARRYTFNYGLGLEFQTGQPSSSSNQPLGETGVSPRVSFGVTRLNFRGLNHTVNAEGQRRRPAAARPDQLRSSALVQQSQLAAHLYCFLRQHGGRDHVHFPASGGIGAGRTDHQQDQHHDLPSYLP